jgi:hypothetical protein
MTSTIPLPFIPTVLSVAGSLVAVGLGRLTPCPGGCRLLALATGRDTIRVDTWGNR